MENQKEIIRVVYFIIISNFVQFPFSRISTQAIITKILVMVKKKKKKQIIFPIKKKENFEEKDFKFSNENDLEKVKEIVENDTFILKSRNKLGDTAFHYVCAFNQNPEVLRYLMKEKYCNANTQNYEGFSCLHFALLFNKLEVIKFLVEQENIDLYLKNKDGYTTFHLAFRSNYIEVIKYLVEVKNCDLNIKSTHENTPLHIALKSNKNLEIVKYLIESKHCDLHALNDSGDTPFHLACFANTNLEIIKYLISVKCNTKIVKFFLFHFFFFF